LKENINLHNISSYVQYNSCQKRII
jgi:hypothetical protein